MEKEIEYITALIGDSVRTNILWALLDGKAYTATELAIIANTSSQNISMHLSKLVQADLLTVKSQGRHKYYAFSRPEVAYAIEAIGSLIPSEKHRKIVNDKDSSGIKHCRTCYDHLAGKVGVLITDALLKQQIIAADNNIYSVSEQGVSFFLEFGINVEELKKNRRAFAKPCLDWSERKYHLAGSLGAALLDRMLLSDYMRKTKNSRTVIITSKGQQYLYDKFKVSA